MRTMQRFHLGSISGAALLGALWLFGPTEANADDLPQHTLPAVDESVPEDSLPAVDEAVPEFRTSPQGITAFSAGQPGIDSIVSNLLGNESEVSIDVNPTNPLNQVVVGHAPGFPTMNTFFTVDGGLTWTLVALGNAQDGLTSTFRFDPSVAFDDNGNVYAGYGVRIPGPVTNSRVVVVCRSTDGGATYTQCTQVATTADIGTLPGNDKWHLATGPDPLIPTQQNVYIAWTQNVSEPGTDQRIVVSGSTDGGTTFSAPLIINDASIAGTNAGNLFADPAVGPNGELYVAWANLNSGSIFVDVSLDGGATFGTDTLVATSAITSFAFIPPQPDRGVTLGDTLDVDRSGGPFDGRLYVTYIDAPNGVPDTDVFVRFSSDGGATWSAATLVNDDGTDNSQFLPWLDVDQQTGLVSVVWYDARNDMNNQQVDVFVALSDDGGATFKPNILVSDGQSDQSVNNASRTINNYLEYIGIAGFDCDAFTVWADNSTNLADLDYFTDQVRFNGLDTQICNLAPICDANGPYVAECGLDTTLDGSGSSDPEGQALVFTWTGPFTPTPTNGATPAVQFPSPTGLKTVDLEVDDTLATAMCSAAVTVQDTLAPTITAPGDKTAECSSPSGTPVDLMGPPTVSDICDANVAFLNDAPALFPLGITTVTWTATDDDGNQATDTQGVTIENTTLPVVMCNNPLTIVPPDTPISFTATATDQCQGDLTPVTTEFDCFKFTKKGKRIDKTSSCAVSIDGDTVTIEDSGGVGDNITWTVVATDNSGNVTTEICSLVVENPGKGNN